MGFSPGSRSLATDLIPVADLTRRGFLTSVSAAGLLTACNSDDDGTGESGGGWSFTDDRGVRVDLPSRPMRIAAYETAGAALINLGVRPVASFGSGPVDQSNPSPHHRRPRREPRSRLNSETNPRKDPVMTILSDEKMSLLAVDVLVWTFADPDELAKHPIYPGLPVAREGHAIFPDEVAGSALAWGSALSLPFFLDRLVPQLEKALAAG
ncbi:MAG: hypothetical protein ACT4NY_19500 [Pseudonocardiales bacterium]